MMDPFRPPNNQGFDGYGGQQRMGMNDMSGSGAMGPGGMVHPNSNMMQNSQMPYGGGGMMPNNSMPSKYKCYAQQLYDAQFQPGPIRK